MKIQHSTAEMDKVIDKVVEDLLKNKIIGWFQGGSEFGPRALGFRSILANPTFEDCIDNLNERVKHREWWRPFAPVIMEEHLNEWFTGNYVTNEHRKVSPYMLFSFQARESHKIPGVVHEDNSSRVQTVNERQNHNLYKLLQAFYKKTEIPILLNTSFNIAGEPIVESPKNAMKTFKSTNIDVLVMNNIYIVKNNERRKNG